MLVKKWWKMIEELLKKIVFTISDILEDFERANIGKSRLTCSLKRKYFRIYRFYGVDEARECLSLQLRARPWFRLRLWVKLPVGPAPAGQHVSAVGTALISHIRSLIHEESIFFTCLIITEATHPQTLLKNVTSSHLRYDNYVFKSDINYTLTSFIS